MIVRQLMQSTKIFLIPALLAFGVSSAWADGQHATVDIHAQTPVPAFCGTIQQVAGEVMVLDSSRAHVDEARKGRHVACDGWISVQTGWAEIKHRDGHLLRVGENSFVQASAEGETLNLLRGLVHVESFDDGIELRLATPNARARMRHGAGMLIYDPARQRSQWVTLERMAVLENRFESETGVAVAEGESSVLDLDSPRVAPDRAKAITVASLKPILKKLDVPEKKRSQAMQVALERQRRVIPATITKVAAMAEIRAPASDGTRVGEKPSSYHRHDPKHKNAAVEQHLKRKWTGGAPTRLLQAKDAEALERRLEAKANAKLQAERKRVIQELEELERAPASMGE